MSAGKRMTGKMQDEITIFNTRILTISFNY